MKYLGFLKKELLNRVWLFVTLWTAAGQASLSFALSHSLLHWVSDAIQPSHSLSPASLPSFDLSQH